MLLLGSDLMYDIYTVMEGDTLKSISSKFKTSPEIIKSINGNITNVLPGMTLVIPKNRNPYLDYYIISEGDTLFEIAKNYNTDPNLLAQLNGINVNDYIYPNQTIVIPRDDLLAYITGSNDSIGRLINEYRVKVEDFVKQNQEVFLKPEQIIFFRKK